MLVLSPNKAVAPNGAKLMTTVHLQSSSRFPVYVAGCVGLSLCRLLVADVPPLSSVLPFRAELLRSSKVDKVVQGCPGRADHSDMGDAYRLTSSCGVPLICGAKHR